MPIPTKGSPEAKAWAEKMRQAREAKLQQPEQPVAELPPVEETAIVGAKEIPEKENYEVVGAKITVDNTEIKSMLESINEDTDVDIYNPLDQGFSVQYNISGYQSSNLTAQERDIRDKAGLPYEKDGGQSQQRITKYSILPPHKVTRLPGKVAHVAVIQLRNYVMRMDKDNYSDVADPAQIRKAEERIILKIANSLDNMQVDHQAEIDKKIAELNRAVI